MDCEHKTMIVDWTGDVIVQSNLPCAMFPIFGHCQECGWQRQGMGYGTKEMFDTEWTDGDNLRVRQGR